VAGGAIIALGFAVLSFRLFSVVRDMP
jgi:hypothetical protein